MPVLPSRETRLAVAVVTLTPGLSANVLLRPVSKARPILCGCDIAPNANARKKSRTSHEPRARRVFIRDKESKPAGGIVCVETSVGV